MNKSNEVIIVVDSSSYEKTLNLPDQSSIVFHEVLYNCVYYYSISNSVTYVTIIFDRNPPKISIEDKLTYSYFKFNDKYICDNLEYDVEFMKNILRKNIEYF